MKIYNYNYGDDLGFRISYGKLGGSPNNIFLKDRKEMLKFFLDKLEDIEYLCVNDRIINKNRLINNNLVLSRYFKLKDIKNVL